MTRGVRRAAELLLPQIAVALIGFVNSRADREMTFSVVYLVPVMAAAYWGGRVSGLLAALSATFVWSLYSEYGLASTTTLVAQIWNVLSRLTLYVVLVLAVDGFVRAHRRITAFAMTDALTGLANARAIHSRLADEVVRSRRTGRPFALLSVDSDHLKVINDRFGHAAGDRLICVVADVLRGQQRGPDLAARLGGDEFVVLLAECDAEGAATAAERIRARVRGAAFSPAPGVTADVTVSIGVATADGAAGPTELLARADAALYAAKMAGRDRVMDWTATGAPARGQTALG